MADASLMPLLSERDPHDLRRRHRRVSLLWSAQVTSAEGESPCTILNLSASGARIRLAGSVSCPDSIELESPRLGACAGRVVWRRGQMLGIAFHELSKGPMDAFGAAPGQPANALVA